MTGATRETGPALRWSGAALVVWTLGVTAGRAVRWPNDFAEAHWLLDYRFGFVKRGLGGEVLTLLLRPFGTEPTEQLIAALSAIVFAGFVAVCLALLFRLVQASTWTPGAYLVALAFATSPFVVMSAHLMGYLDHVVFLLTAAAIVLVTRGRPWLGALCQAGAVLVHEAAIVYGAPVFVVAAIRARPRGFRSLWPVVLPVGAFLAVAAGARLWQPADFQDLYSQHLARFPFVAGDMHIFVPEWLTPSFFDHYTQQAHRFGSRIASAEMYGLVLPTTLALLLHVMGGSRVRPMTGEGIAVGAALLLPQFLHLAAWDTVRIWTYTIGAAGLVAWTYAQPPRLDAGSVPIARHQTPGTAGTLQTPRMPDAVLVAASVAIVVNVMMMTPLLDNLADRFDLATRLALYAPTLAGVVGLLRLAR